MPNEFENIDLSRMCIFDFVLEIIPKTLFG
jgi:hypothetical protein